MSCTIELRQFSPLSKIFMWLLYITVNEITSYFWRDLLHIAWSKAEKLKDEPFLERKLFPMVIYLCSWIQLTTVINFFNQNSMYWKMKHHKNKLLEQSIFIKHLHKGKIYLHTVNFNTIYITVTRLQLMKGKRNKNNCFGHTHCRCVDSKFIRMAHSTYLKFGCIISQKKKKKRAYLTPLLAQRIL